MTPQQVQSVEEMLAFGRSLGEKAQQGDVLALVGGLGAGKTHLTQGIVQGLASAVDVTSPTFTLVHEYPDGRLPIYHFDLYRMEIAEELESIGWDDYLDAEGVCIVEWADRFPDMLPPGTHWWSLEITGPTCRSLTFRES